jgi:hypothetical protein
MMLPRMLLALSGLSMERFQEMVELLEGKNGRPEQFGSVLNFEFQSDGAATLLGGMVMADEPAQCHIAIVADP